MFIITIDYKVPLDKIDPLIPDHMLFLKKYYDAGLFIISGRKEPRTGGIIIVKGDSRRVVEDLIQEDSFFKADVADYSITEFIPGTVAPGFESLLA